MTVTEIHEFLPKYNCGLCGASSCLAFAMSLADGTEETDTCPYIRDEARANLKKALTQQGK